MSTSLHGRRFSASEVQRIPTILVIAPRGCGKSQTVVRWRQRFGILRLVRGDAACTVERREPEYTPPATENVEDWIVEADGEPQLLIIDAPGEAVLPRHHGEGGQDDLIRHRASICERLTGARVVGVLICARPPAAAERTPGRVYCHQSEYDDRVRRGLPDAASARKEVTHSIEVASALLSRAGVPPDGVRWMLQVGFADLVDYSDGGPQVALRDAYESLAPFLEGGGAGLVGAGPGASQGLQRVEQATLALHGAWIGRLPRAKAPWFVYAQHSVEIEGQGLDFGLAHQGVALLRIFTDLAARAEVVNRRRRGGWAVVFAVLAGLAGLGVALAAAWVRPTALGSQSAAACKYLASLGSPRCDCLPVVAAAAPASSTLKERVERLEPFVDACHGAAGGSGAALASYAAATALLSPEAFCSSSLPDAVWTGAVRPESPLRDQVEVAWGSWLIAGVKGAPSETRSLADQLAGDHRYAAAAVALQRSASTSGCRQMWSAARGGKVGWVQASTACRAREEWAHLSAAEREAFAADAPPVHRKGLAPLPGTATHPPVPRACAGVTVADLARGESVEPDGLTAANLAAMADSAAVAAAWLGRAGSVDPALAAWLVATDRSLDPATQAAHLRAAVPKVAPLLLGAFQVVETGEVVHGKKGGARLPKLRLGDALVLGCGLTRTLTPESPELEPLPGAMEDVRLPEVLADVLLDVASAPGNPDWALCRASADLQLVRTSNPAARAARARSLRAALDQVVMAGPTGPIRNAAAANACHVAAELGELADFLTAHQRLMGLPNLDAGVAPRCAARAALRFASDGDGAALETVLGLGQVDAKVADALRRLVPVVAPEEVLAPPTTREADVALVRSQFPQLDLAPLAARLAEDP